MLSIPRTISRTVSENRVIKPFKEKSASKEAGSKKLM
jgi:hypothetical protein